MLFTLNETNAQDTQPGKWLTVNLDMTDSMTVQALGFEYTSKLATKVLNIVSRNGRDCKISCVRDKESDPSKIELGDLNTGILCKPKLEILEQEVINTGMESVNATTISLSIFIQSVQGNVIYASITKEYQGTGNNPKKSLNNAIRSIRVKDNSYKKFLEEARGEVARYYEEMCGPLLEQASTLATFKKYREAIYLLWPIPYEVKCHKEARDTMLSIYKRFVEHNCSRFLFDAKTHITSKDYREAMQVLRYIDPEASCAPKAIELMNEIAAKVDEQEKEYIELYKKMRENEFELEQARYRSMGNMTRTINFSKLDIEKKE